MPPTEWVWSPEHSRYYRVNFDGSDQIVYTWTPEQTEAEERAEAGVKYLTNGTTTRFLDDGKIDVYRCNEDVPYLHLAMLGKGNSGLVEKVEHKITHEVFARKSISVPKRRQAEQESIFLNEVAIIRRLCAHPHFIQVVEAYRTKQHFGIILRPVADEDNLADYLDKYMDLKERVYILGPLIPNSKSLVTEYMFYNMPLDVWQAGWLSCMNSASGTKTSSLKMYSSMTATSFSPILATL